jgi:hypothetical protein
MMGTATLEPRVLRHLGNALIARADAAEAAERASYLELTDEGLERLADIVISGSRPTIGFWRRYRIAAP